MAVPWKEASQSGVGHLYLVSCSDSLQTFIVHNMLLWTTRNCRNVRASRMLWPAGLLRFSTFSRARYNTRTILHPQTFNAGCQRSCLFLSFHFVLLYYLIFLFRSLHSMHLRVPHKHITEWSTSSKLLLPRCNSFDVFEMQIQSIFVWSCTLGGVRWVCLEWKSLFIISIPISPFCCRVIYQPFISHAPHWNVFILSQPHPSQLGYFQLQWTPANIRSLSFF